MRAPPTPSHGQSKIASPDRCGGNRQSTPVTACPPLADLARWWPIERAAGLPAALEILHGATEVPAARLLCPARRSALPSAHVNAHSHDTPTARPRPIHGTSTAHPLPPTVIYCYLLSTGIRVLASTTTRRQPPLQTHPSAPVQPTHPLSCHPHSARSHRHGPTAHGTALRRSEYRRERPMAACAHVGAPRGSWYASHRPL